MLVKSNAQLWRNKGVFGEGPWGIWLICQGSAMGKGYTPHMSVANKQWLFLLDIHWRNNFGPLQCRGKANSCFRLRSTLASSEERIKSEIPHSLVLVSSISLCPSLVTEGFSVSFSTIQQSPSPAYFCLFVFSWMTDEYVGVHTVWHRSSLLLNGEVCRAEPPSVSNQTCPVGFGIKASKSIQVFFCSVLS